jgi:hypothetical protein
MRRGAALLGIAAFCMSACANDWPPSAAQPINAVLAYEAALSGPPDVQPRPEQSVCYAEMTAGRAFEQEREDYRALLAHRPGFATDDASRITQLRQLGHVGEVAWQKPFRPGERVEAGNELDRATAADLAAAARRFLATEPGPVAPIALRPLPPQLPAVGRPNCRNGSLQFTAPAITGDVAFVEATLSSCSNCASGSLYALRREGDQWRVIAIAHTWIA